MEKEKLTGLTDQLKGLKSSQLRWLFKTTNTWNNQTKPKLKN